MTCPWPDESSPWSGPFIRTLLISFSTYGVIPSLDLCCHKVQHQVSNLCATDSRALDSDALVISWEKIFTFAFPPYQILTHVLTLIVVATVMVSRPSELAQRHPMPLPHWEKMLKQPRSVFHQNPCMLNLHAWRLSKLSQ